MIASVLVVAQLACTNVASKGADLNGADMDEPGLTPNYPADNNCSPLTSLYMSWIDVDGSRRDERHSGVDGGRLRDQIVAPAPGVIAFVWQANWGWGLEGALIIRHSRADVGLQDGPEFYYSEFDHLRYSEIRSTALGKRVERGDKLATVFRPGGKRRFLPEVHWEVWTLDDDSATTWNINKFGSPFWENQTANLIDPLYMLSLNAPPRTDNGVDIPVFNPLHDYREFRGFTYILPCPGTAKRVASQPARRR